MGAIFFLRCGSGCHCIGTNRSKLFRGLGLGDCMGTRGSKLFGSVGLNTTKGNTWAVRIQGDNREVRPLGSNSFLIFIYFLAKTLQNNMLAQPPRMLVHPSVKSWILTAWFAFCMCGLICGQGSSVWYSICVLLDVTSCRS